MPTRTKTVILSTAVVLTAAAVIAVWWVLARNGWATDGSASPVPAQSAVELSSPSSVPSAAPSVALPPPPAPEVPPETPPDDEGEPASTSAPSSPVPSPAGGSGIEVVITYATWVPESSSVEVGAYVPVVDASGQCTLSLTRGEQSTVQTRDALENVSTMSCGGFEIPGGTLSAGTWTAVVAYTSTWHDGTSTPVEVIVR